MIRNTRKRSRRSDVWMKVKDPETIRRWRKRAGFTQTDLAALCRCSQSTIHLLETGKLMAVTDGLALMVARRLNVPWEDLFAARESTRSTVGVNSASTNQVES